MKYKIVKILHSGRVAPRGSVRTDGKYPSRIGKICQLENVEVGKRLTIDYLYDENGNEYPEKVFCATDIKEITKAADYLAIETLNSVYFLKKIPEEKGE